MRLCLSERESRCGTDNPSLITDLLPDIVLAIFGFLFMLLITVTEEVFCSYIAAKQASTLQFTVVVFLVSAIGCLAVCHGICLMYDSLLFVLLGGGILATVITSVLIPSSGPGFWALAIVPTIVVLTGLIITAAHRLCMTRSVLNLEERILRIAEGAILVIMLAASVNLVHRIRSTSMGKVGVNGMITGISMCIIAVLRLRMCCLEVRTRPLDERLFTKMVVAADANPPLGEVQISIRSMNNDDLANMA